MYTGRITEIGTVIETGSRLVIEAPKTVAGLTAGGSINVNGTCLCAVRVERQAVVRGSSGGADPMTEIYDSIGATYNRSRRADPVSNRQSANTAGSRELFHEPAGQGNWAIINAGQYIHVWECGK